MLVNNSEETKHLQISGYYNNLPIEIDVGYLLTKDSILFEVSVTDVEDNLQLYYSLNPDLEELKRIEEKYCTVPNELFKCIYVGLVTQCFWNDEEIAGTRTKYILMGTPREEIVRLLLVRFSKLGVEYVYNLIVGIAERADIKKIWNMVGGC